MDSNNSEIAGKDGVKSKNIVHRTRNALGDIGNRLKKNPSELGAKPGESLQAAKNVVLGATAKKDIAVSTNRPHIPGTPQNSPSKRGEKSKKSVSRGTGNENRVSNKNGNGTTAEEEKSIAYWKELAEFRRQALEDALQENFELHERVEDLRKQNSDLEELVKEAKSLADMVNDALEEEDLDESGIGDTIDVITSSIQ